ncbi:uncharacterized protein LOC109837769 [Asparagus officinalis]|uniref:uncharacterized protein LOC109837769 n=1 Tax=Asparagus officinalis TaxID=4686 RepID=UPI00098E319B|nr:uncharacterized protein LOC109837769 [Asparagus officinalis]XP_020261708.1 uncharacterized protein LOC109837769 [Asparagus officinalis]
MPEVKKSFASLFSDNRRPGKGLSLNFVPPSQKNAAVFSKEEWKVGEDYWKNALIGHVIGLNAKFKSMEAYINKAWGKISNPKITLIKSGVFLFDFQSEQQMRKILEAGPWFFGSRPLVLKPWSIDTEMEKIQDCTYPMWVQFPNLRLNLWSQIGISKISSLIGCPITTDMLTATRQRLSFARVLLEVKLPLKEQLPDSIEIQGPDGEKYNQKVIYELKPKWCTFCNMVGHDTDFCRRQKIKKVWVPVNRQKEKEMHNAQTSQSAQASHSAQASQNVQSVMHNILAEKLQTTDSRSEKGSVLNTERLDTSRGEGSLLVTPTHVN